MREIIIFTTIIFFTLSSMASALTWNQVALQASKVVQTSTGAVRIVAKYPLTEEVAKATARAAVAGGAAARIAANPIVGLIGLGIGLWCLKHDLNNLVDYIRGEVGNDPATRSIIVITPTYRYEIRTIGTGKIPSGSYYYLRKSWTITTNSSGVTYQSGSSQSNYGPGTPYVIVKEIQNGAEQPTTYWMVVGFVVTHINNYDGDLEITDQSQVTDAMVDEWIKENPDLVQELVESEIAPMDELETGNQILDDVQGSATETYDETDPETGEDTETVEADTTGLAPMRIPGQPVKPNIDTSIEAPEVKSIDTLISGWLSNAPFMAIINSMEVQASDGQCEFTIPLPETLGGNATMNFCQFSTLWAAISVIIISIAYIYGAMIIFGGKS